MILANSKFTVRTSTILVILGALGASVAFGGMLIFDARIALIPFALATAYLVLVYPVARVAFVVLGGIFTLQGEEGLNAPKFIYMFGSLMCVLIAFALYQRSTAAYREPLLAPLLNWTWQWGILLLLSMLVALATNIDVVTWLRGSIPYILFASTPFIVYDVVRSLDESKAYRQLRFVFVVAGSLSSLSWFISWTNGRGYAQLPIDRLFLWSFCLSFGLYCYALSCAVHREGGNILWGALAVAIVFLFVLTGTRQSVLFVVPVVFLALRGNIRAGLVIKSLTRLAVPAVIVIGVVAYVAISVLNLDVSTAADRFLDIGGITNQESEGRSYRERLQVNALVKDAFWSNPIVGVSPGHTYSWVTETGREKSGLSMDTPLALPASFGLIGVVVAVVTVMYAGRFLNGIKRVNQLPAVEIDAIRSFMAFLLIYVLAGSPFEDKGLSFAFIFLIGLAMLRVRELNHVPASQGMVEA